MGIRLAIIEDIEDVRKNLEDFFLQQEEIADVLAVDSMEAFFAQVSPLTLPDIVLSDIGLPGMNGIDGIKRIKSLFPAADIIMLTVFNDSDRIFKSLCAGAIGYALKSTPLPEIKQAIFEIKAGGSYMSPAIARKVVEHFAPVKNSSELLSAREKQIIRGLTEGLSYKLIAARLSVSIDAVRFHIKNIYRKLHVNSKAEVINKAFRGEID